MAALAPRPEPDVRIAEAPLRILAALCAGLAAATHVALGVVDLIPGEPTRGPLFLAMGAGYAAAVPVVFALRRRDADLAVLVYAVGLVLAYVTSRTELPVEPIGVATKVAETLLAAILALLIRRR